MKTLAPLTALALAFGCARPARPPERPSEPVLETRRVFFPGTKQLQREYRILIHPDGLVEQHGHEKEWYESGALEAEREFRHGKPSGTWSSLYEDGTQRSEVSFGDGQSPAPIRWWHPEGTLAGEGMGISGLKDGHWTYWYADGTLAEEGPYHLSVREGFWTFWYPDGSKRAEGDYAGGLRVGDWKLWDEEGKLVLRTATVERPDGRVQEAGAEQP